MTNAIKRQLHETSNRLAQSRDEVRKANIVIGFLVESLNRPHYRLLTFLVGVFPFRFERERTLRASLRDMRTMKLLRSSRVQPK